MKITGVKTHIVDTVIPEEHRVRSGAGYKLRRQAAFVELTTDYGLHPDLVRHELSRIDVCVDRTSRPLDLTTHP